MSKSVRLLLVDDHPIVRTGLRMLFQSEPDMVVVGEVNGGEEALEAVQTLHPDVVIMDVAMPGMNGIEATRRIKESSPETAVLALTMHEDEQYFFAMLHAGASGYIPKRAAPDDLVSAIRVVAEGNFFLYSTLARFLMKDMAEQTPAASQERVESLTPRETEVLTYIAEGFTSREIADTLVISVKTVERHRENIMTKLDIHNRVELVKFAIRKGLIQPE
ncbi:MAG: response regulator transcription factor [Caldilinea sp.]|nr:response regulator transcription factor [Caldilinea sp.]MCB9114475.1 response regulator transcription factor [Caldilineaceae bacterium]MCB9120940.1 response regulator transcription factor [Caldilineaceae bacterium]MCO5213084.1 response regulator transcription factor [Caldilinea sp.]MCW5844784.1 response regulator transcription factor [Caldilinea sp.]